MEQTKMRQRSVYTYGAIFLLATAANVVLARFGVAGWPIGPGASSLYFAVAFMIPCTLWFGAWGAAAAYLGCFLGAGVLSGLSPTVNLYWSLADLWQVLIPLLAFRAFRADAGLRTGRDLAVFLAFGWLLNNVAGALWGAGTLVLGEVASLSDAPSIFAGWLTGNLVVTGFISILLLKLVTPRLEKAGLLVKGYWR